MRCCPGCRAPIGRVRGKRYCIRCRIKRKCLIGEGDAGCWVWQGFLKKGEPYFKGLVSGAQASPVAVARASYVAWVGPIREGARVRRICGNGKCVNPAHLVMVEGAVIVA